MKYKAEKGKVYLEKWDKGDYILWRPSEKGNASVPMRIEDGSINCKCVALCGEALMVLRGLLPRLKTGGAIEFVPVKKNGRVVGIKYKPVRK